MRRAVSILSGLTPIILAVILVANQRARAQSEPRSWPAEAFETDEVMAIIGANDRLESDIRQARAVLQVRYDTARAFARGRLMLAPTTVLDFDRGTRRWLEVAPVTSAK